MDLQVLKKSGWYLNQANVESLAKESGKTTNKDILSLVLETDLKEVGDTFLADSFNHNKVESLVGPVVLQVQKVRNVSVPNEKEEQRWHEGDVMKLLLTDGHQMLNAINIEDIQSMNDKLLPGSKVLLTGRVDVVDAFALLSKSSCKVLGGRVHKLAEAHALKKNLSHLKRVGETSDAPPPFVPFEKRNKNRSNDADLKVVQALKNQAESKKPIKDNSTSVQQASTDASVSSMVDMGFSLEDSLRVLSLNRGNVSKAVSSLLEEEALRGSAQQGSRGSTQEINVQQGNVSRGTAQQNSLQQRNVPRPAQQTSTQQTQRQTTSAQKPHTYFQNSSQPQHNKYNNPHQQQSTYQQSNKQPYNKQQYQQETYYRQQNPPLQQNTTKQQIWINSNRATQAPFQAPTPSRFDNRPQHSYSVQSWNQSNTATLERAEELKARSGESGGRITFKHATVKNTNISEGRGSVTSSNNDNQKQSIDRAYRSSNQYNYRPS